MQTLPNTERYMVTCRGSKMAITLGDVRVFDSLSDAVEHARETYNHPGYGVRIFLVANDKRPKEIKDWR